MAHPNAQPPTALRARLLYNSALFDDSGAWEKQCSRYEESLTILDGLGETFRVERAYVLMWLGVRLCLQPGEREIQPGEREKGTRHMQEALRIFEDSGDKWGLGFALNLYGGTIFELDKDFNAAWALAERGMEVARQTGEQFLIAVFIDNYGYYSVRQGLYSEGKVIWKRRLRFTGNFKSLYLHARL